MCHVKSTVCTESTESVHAESTSSSSSNQLPTKIAPCKHNAWERKKWLDQQMCARLRCLVCKVIWDTQLTLHRKCPKFYSGQCDGTCGLPHIFSRGTKPEHLSKDSEGNVVSSSESLRSQKKRSRAGKKEGAAAAAATSPSTPCLTQAKVVDTPLPEAVRSPASVSSENSVSFSEGESSSAEPTTPQRSGHAFRFNPYSHDSPVQYVH